MRIKLIFKLIGKDYVLPCNYMYEISSCLYKVLNEGDAGFTSWLHDEGYCKERKALQIRANGGRNVIEGINGKQGNVRAY